MRTDREIEAEARLMATQVTAKAGHRVFTAEALCNIMEDQYWDDWSKAYDEALVDLEAENEKH